VSEYLVECFWPGVKEVDLETLDQRALAAAAATSTAGHPVRYLGSLLIREDEVVLCEFTGSPDDVRNVAELAEIPFERILGAASSPSLLGGRASVA
jgi:hypothetical protein